MVTTNAPPCSTSSSSNATRMYDPVSRQSSSLSLHLDSSSSEDANERVSSKTDTSVVEVAASSILHTDPQHDAIVDQVERQTQIRIRACSQPIPMANSDDSYSQLANNFLLMPPTSTSSFQNPSRFPVTDSHHPMNMNMTASFSTTRCTSTRNVRPQSRTSTSFAPVPLERTVSFQDQPLHQMTSMRSMRSTTGRRLTDANGTFRTTTVEHVRELFAAQLVRFQDRWTVDLWIFMKNAHPYIAPIAAHRWHPFKKHDRLVVLLIAILVALVSSGVFATQPCCISSVNQPVTIKREIPSSTGRRLSTREETTVSCASFHEDCDDQLVFCAQGSSCHQRHCVPSVQTAPSCALASCPIGWECNGRTQACEPAVLSVCYLPPRSSSRWKLQLADDGNANNDENGISTIDAIFNLIKIANENATNHQPTSAPSPSPSNNPPPSPSLSPSTSPAPTSSPTPSPVPSPSPAPQPPAPSSSSSGSKTSSSIRVTLTHPANRDVYGLTSIIPVEWQVQSLQSDTAESPIESFQVEFSRDGGQSFALLAEKVTPVIKNETWTFRYDWDLSQNDSFICTHCVLRMCVAQPSTLHSLCLRSDGQSPATTDAIAHSSDKMTFQIVRQVMQCSCGVEFASFVVYSYILALFIPFVTLICEQLVTFYQHTKCFNLFARVGNTSCMPYIGYYDAKTATRTGRVLLVIIIVALVLVLGFLFAQVNSSRFFDQTKSIRVLWIVTFVLVLVIGFVYTTIVYAIVFTIRWGSQADDFEKNQEAGALSDFGLLLIPNEHQWQPSAPIPTRVQRVDS